MSKHSKIWHQRKAAIAAREKAMKEELEHVSNLFEGRAKMILMITLATGGFFLILFVIYKAFFKSKPHEAEVKKPRSTKKTVMRTLITERIMSAVLSYLGQQLNQAVKGNSGNKSKKD